jgi:hypothetical protein
MTDKQFAELVGELVSAFYGIQNAIMPGGTTSVARDATGGYTASVGESLMGVTAGLVQIAESISDLAAAVREHTEAITPDNA